ncbi:Hypothetical predicted protein, partial [Paramuricea clavata]
KVHSAPQGNTPEEIMMLEHLNTTTTSEFLANVLFYIGGFIVSKLVQELECPFCKSCLLSCFSTPTPDHDYCAMGTINGLRIPSQSVYQVVEFSEKVFKAYVCKEGRTITREKKLKQRMIMEYESTTKRDMEKLETKLKQLNLGVLRTKNILDSGKRESIKRHLDALRETVRESNELKRAAEAAKIELGESVEKINDWNNETDAKIELADIEIDQLESWLAEKERSEHLIAQEKQFNV